MSSAVYFANIRSRTPKDNKVTKLQRLFDAAQFGEIVAKNDLVALKVHFGEKGSDAYINPVFIRQIVDKVKTRGGKPFVTDTNTLYSGSRFNAVDHIQTAIEHGFDYAVINAPILIADGLKSQSICEVAIKSKHFDVVKVASDIVKADSMIVISHFKGHELSGFGGAIKNLAMGCAPAAGKKDQHQPGIFVIEKKCISCGKCIEICPVNAIGMRQEKARINREICTGCAECMHFCQAHAIEFDWETKLTPFMERMTEYAQGVLQCKKGKIGFINVLLNIVPDCDCMPLSDAAIVPDIGILASMDPIALDKASYDLVNKQSGNRQSHLKSNFKPGEDKFKGVWGKTDSLIQINYGEALGMGSSHYNLIEV
ncbi:MAG: DUF362 domain-containing protein [Candidatus Omnitrophica bacterium]|nr:DUF362 domain-containing protein [Candidatus Omnitrophota bacterium]